MPIALEEEPEPGFDVQKWSNDYQYLAQAVYNADQDQTGDALLIIAFLAFCFSCAHINWIAKDPVMMVANQTPVCTLNTVFIMCTHSCIIVLLYLEDFKIKLISNDLYIESQNY